MTDQPEKLMDLAARSRGEDWDVMLRAALPRECRDLESRLKAAGYDVETTSTHVTPEELRETLARCDLPFAVKKRFKGLTAREVAACAIAGHVERERVTNAAASGDQVAADALLILAACGSV